MKTVVDLL